MQASAIKKQRRRGVFKASFVKAKGQPIQVLYLKPKINCQLRCEDGTLLQLAKETIKIGGYGTKKTPNGWMHLVKVKERKYEWVYQANFYAIKAF